MANKIKYLIDAYPQIIQQAQDVVLATVIETFGSTYQKAGARMFITKEGELIGLLGGGCFESDLLQQAKTVFETGKTKTVFYDMRSPDDVIWGLGLGCNGAVKVCLQLLEVKNNFSPLNQIIEAINANEAGVLICVYESENVNFSSSYNLFLPLSKLDFAPEIFAQSVLQTVTQKKPRLESHLLENQKINVFYDFIEPPLQLLILGAGVDAVPLVQYAKILGWRVTVVDYRANYLKKLRFPQADMRLEIFPESLNEKLNLKAFSALVLMTHNVEYDRRYLNAIVDYDIPFLGLLGPSHRKDKLLQALGEDAAKISERVFAPVGLDIGAETPEEIALSIMAGIQAQLHGRTGQQLNVKHHDG